MQHVYLSVRSNGESSGGTEQNAGSSLWSQRDVCSGCVWGGSAVNVCGLLELLVQKSGPFLLSLWSFCLFPHPCFNLRGSHLQEEEVAESGVSGRTFAHSLLAQPVALFSYLLCFLTLCSFFFLLTLLLYQNFRCKPTSDLIYGALLKSRPQSCEIIDDYSGKM